MLHRLDQYLERVSAKELSLALVPGLLSGFAGMCAPFFAFILGGAGHGWVSPFMPSLGAPFIGAIAWIAWLARRKPWGIGLACILLAGAVLGDFTVINGTLRETSYFHKMWERSPAIIVFWTAAWLYPQLLLVATLVAGNLSLMLGHPSPPNSNSQFPDLGEKFGPLNRNVTDITDGGGHHVRKA
jgi:hypothetical protein